MENARAETFIDWSSQGACKGLNPKMMYPDFEDKEGTEAAKQVCSGCIVAAFCLDYALQNREQGGVWGGMSEPERRKHIRVGNMQPLASSITDS